MPSPSLLQRLKERKLVQWAVAYAAGAFVVFQLLDALSEPLGLTTTIQRGVLIVVVVGFLITVVLAWYHGEKGRQKVSGPELLMVAALLVVAGGVLALLNRPESQTDSRTARVGDARPRVAVLPCANMSTDLEDAYLASALHDEVLLQLQKISSLFSIGRTSVLQYAEDPPSIPAIASALGVDFVGECSVQKYAEKIRLIFQLLDGNTGGQVWAQDYDGDLTVADLLDIQGDIAKQVAAAIGARLTPGELDRIEALPTQNLQAYQSYLLANERWRTYDTEGREDAAVELYEQAVAFDPQFAQAHAMLSRAHSYIWWYYLDRSPERLQKAEKAVATALDLDPNLPEAHLALGFYHYMGHLDYDLALLEFNEALRGQPGYSEALSGIAFVKRRQGLLTETVARLRQASELDPLSSEVVGNLAETHFLLREFEEAEKQYRRLLDLEPTSVSGFHELTELYVRWEGATEKGRGVLRLAEETEVEDPLLEYTGIWLETLERNYAAALEKLESIGPVDHERQQFLFIPKPLWTAWVYGFLGLRDEEESSFQDSRRTLEALVELSPDDPRYRSALGLTYAGLGMKDAAIREGERGASLLPIERDAYRGTYRVADLAKIYMKVDEPDAALQQLERLLSIPSFITVPVLEIDPTWDPLRSHPRFQALLERYSDDMER